QKRVLYLWKPLFPAVLLLHSPAAQHGHSEATILILLGPEVEVTDCHTNDVAQRRVLIGIPKLHHICFAGVVDDPLLEPLDLENLHLDDEPAAGRVGALDVDDRELELRDVDVLLAGEVLHVDDAVLALELEEMVEQRDE